MHIQNIFRWTANKRAGMSPTDTINCGKTANADYNTQKVSYSVIYWKRWSSVDNLQLLCIYWNMWTFAQRKLRIAAAETIENRKYPYRYQILGNVKHEVWNNLVHDHQTSVKYRPPNDKYLTSYFSELGAWPMSNAM